MDFSAEDQKFCPAAQASTDNCAVKPSTGRSELWAVLHLCYNRNSMCPFSSQDLLEKNSQTGNKMVENKIPVCLLWCFLQRFCLSVRIKYKSFGWQMYPSHSLGSRKLLAESPDVTVQKALTPLWSKDTEVSQHCTGVQTTLCVKKGLGSAILKHLVSLLV